MSDIVDSERYKINSERVPGVEGRRFREGGKLHRYVRVYIKVKDRRDLDLIQSVQYELHPTFRQRYQVSVDRLNNFQILIWTYGFFNCQATLVMKDSPPKVIKGFVKWTVPRS